MLIRFLSIATMSVTLLTFQAINSSETKSSLPEDSIQAEAESIFSENSTFSALYQKKEETESDKQSEIINAKYIHQHQGQPTIILAAIGKISLKLPKVEHKVRPSYLPPIAFISKEEDKQAINKKTQLTASLDTKTTKQTIKVREVVKNKKLRKKKSAKYKKSKRSKKYRKKYAHYKKSKYRKYSLGKPIKRRKYKRRYKNHYKPVNYLSTLQ